MKQVKKIVYTASALLVLLVLNQCYLAKQGSHMVRHMSSARDIDDVLKDENLPRGSRDMLLLVK